MHDVKSNIKVLEHIAAVSRGAGAVNGTTIDLGAQGATSVSFLISAGAVTASATLDAKLQHSDNGSTWSDVVADGYNDAGIAQLTVVGRTRLHYTKALKQFVRVVMTVAGTTPTIASGVTAVLGGLKHRPVAYGAGE